MLVARQIVADINRRGNVPGDRLPPEKMMLEKYQIGRGTLRESLRYLELQGLITLKPGPGGGPVVESPNSVGLATSLTLLLQVENAPYRNIVEARGTLEPAMSSLAALRMSDDELETMRVNLERMRAGIDDEEVFSETNREFHDIVAHGSGNVLFAHMIDALTGILDGTSMGIEYPQHRRVAVHAAHTRIYEALLSRDASAAADTMREHIDEYTQFIGSKYPKIVESAISWS